jgi:hypothetical protein
LPSNIIIFILCGLVLILLLLVIILLLKSIHRSTSRSTSNGNCRLIASSSINKPKNNFTYLNENQIILEREFISQSKKFGNFNEVDFDVGKVNKIIPPQNRNSHYNRETSDAYSPLILNSNEGITNKNIQINNSESDSFTNDENSKSTLLFPCSIDESNAKQSLCLNKQNPISIYYC